MNFPPNWQPPAFYLTATPEDVALALELGASAVKHMKEKAIDTVRRQTHSDITESYEARIKRLQKEYDSERADLVAELERLEKDATQRQQRVRAEIRESTRELLEAKEAQIRSLETTLQGLGGKFETLQNNLTRVYTSSKEKGTVGEIIVESMIKKAYDCDVEVVSKESQTADLRMTRASGKVYFWEVKNYTRMVSKEEVEKFRRDLRLHPSICGGVLVSLRTGIVGKTRGGDIDVEFLEDGRAILFLSNLFARDDIVFYLQTLRPFLDCLERLAQPRDEVVRLDAPDLAALQQKAVLVTTLMRNHAGNVLKHQNSIVNHRKRVDSMFTEFQAFLLEAETQINTVLRLVMSDSAAEQAAMTVAVGVDLPLTVFLKTALTDYAERERDFVTWFMENAEIRDGSDVQVKELLEKAVAHKKSWNEKFVRGMRALVFQEAVWPHGSRTLRGVAWRLAEQSTLEAAAEAAHKQLEETRQRERGLLAGIAALREIPPFMLLHTPPSP